MLNVFGVQVVDLICHNIDPATGVPDAALGSCVYTIIPLPGGATINVGAPSTLFVIAGFGISILAIIIAQAVARPPPGHPAGHRRRRRRCHSLGW